jgi:HSP90 family molecular chaperone
MHATASNMKVQCVLPIRTMKSDEIKQEEYDKFYKFTASNKYGKAAENTKRYVGRFFKNMMPSNLSLVKGDVNSDDPLLNTSRELLQQHKFGYRLNDTAQQIEAMMQQTQGVEVYTMLDVQGCDGGSCDQKEGGDSATGRFVSYDASFL